MDVESLDIRADEGGQIIDTDAPLIQAPDSDATINQMPADIEEFKAVHGLNKTPYECQIVRIKGDGEAPSPVPGVYKNRIPSLHQIGEWFGPGEYEYQFSFKQTPPGGGRKKNVTEKMPFTLGYEWDAVHKKYKLDQAIKQAAENRRRVQEHRLENQLTSDEVKELTGKGKGELEALRESAQILKEFGVQIGGQGGGGDNKFMEFLIVQMREDKRAAIENQQFQLKMMQESNKQMMAVFGMMFQAVSQNNQQTPVNPMELMKESMNMIGQIVDFKKDLSEEKQTWADKIIDLIEEVLPSLLALAAAKGPKAAGESRIVQTAKAHPDYKKVISDPISLKYIIERMFTDHGAENTNTMLATLGLNIEVDDSGVVKQKAPAGGAQPDGAATQSEPPKKDDGLEPANPPPPRN